MSDDTDREEPMPGGELPGYQEFRLVAGRYALLRALGRGGMGTVWLADDQLTTRQVAVKELRPPAGLSAAERAVWGQRALREARSAARVRHRNVVTLYDVLPAADEEVVYLILELVEGPSLAQLIERGEALPEADVAAYGLQLLSVLAAAHSLGIVHRDIKPGNILIAPGGQAKLTDFGIAHTIGDTRLTQSGIMGTQAYMAPELFGGAPITPAADLWSLGATLCHAVDGRGPFSRDTTEATLRAILYDALPEPRCGPGLAAAIGGLLERDPARRATTEQARAVLLRSFPAGVSRHSQRGGLPPLRPPAPAGAGSASDPAPPPPPPRARRGGRAAVAAGAAVVTAAGITTGILMTRSGSSAGSAASSATRPHPGASASVVSERPAAVMEPPPDKFGTGQFESVAFSPSGQSLAASTAPGGIAGTLTLWNTAAAKLTETLPFQVTTGAAFSPDGTTLAFGDTNARVDLWNIAARKVVATLPDPYQATNADAVAFSPDGKTLAFSDDTGNVYLWNVASHRMIATLTDPNLSQASLTTLAFSPDGKTLADGSQSDGSVDLWNVAQRRLIATVQPMGIWSPSTQDWVSFSSDSTTLAVYYGSLGVQLWSVASGAQLATLPGSGASGDNYPDVIAYSPDGKVVAGAGALDGSIKLWDIAARKQVAALTESDGQAVSAAAFSPGGKTLATADAGGQICLWTMKGTR